MSRSASWASSSSATDSSPNTVSRIVESAGQSVLPIGRPPKTRNGARPMPKTGRSAVSLFAVVSLAVPMAAVPVQAETVTVTARRANVRRAPDLKSEVVASVAAGTVLQVEGKEGDWYKVRLEPAAGGRARTGDVSASLVKA